MIYLKLVINTFKKYNKSLKYIIKTLKNLQFKNIKRSRKINKEKKKSKSKRNIRRNRKSKRNKKEKRKIIPYRVMRIKSRLFKISIIKYNIKVVKRF